MIIKDYKVNVYDIEVFPNCFHCTVYNTETGEHKLFEISQRKNQVNELLGYFYSENYDRMFIGYNNHHYDDAIINYIIDYYYVLLNKDYIEICKSLYNMSQVIINSEDGHYEAWKRWKYAHYFKSMDILTMLYSSKLRVGLKEMQITMHYSNVLEYDGDFSKDIPVDKIEEMIQYNINDVDSTTTLLDKCKKDIDLRLWIESEYGFECLSMDSVKFGETLLGNLYCKETGISKQHLKAMRSPADFLDLNKIIFPFIHFEDKILQDVLNDMKKQIISTKSEKGIKAYENKFAYHEVLYSVGVGGLHTLNTPEIFKPKEDEYIGHVDVNSLYPSMIVRYNIGPQHLGKIFLQIYANIREQRLIAKHSGHKLKSDALKLTLNSVTGKMQQETSWMYDPENVFKIRINGQLILLMLTERLVHLGCKIIQDNTDGIMFVAKKGKADLVQEAISDIENLTGLTFESGNYEAFYQYAGNDYFGIVEGYNESKNSNLIEKKGLFITKNKLGKGLSPVIIPEAVIEYFISGTPVKETIEQCTDIKKFLMTQRVDKKFKIEYNDKIVQRINRFYASTNGYYLYKYKEEKGCKKYSNILTKSGVTILNKFDGKPIVERHINYQYYESEARKIINDFTCKELDLFNN